MVWIFHIVPEGSVKWVKERGFLTAATPEGVCFSLGSQEGVYAETCLLRNEPYIDAFKNLSILAFRFEDLKRKYPLYPTFYDPFQEFTVEKRYPTFRIGWYCLLPEMQVWIPEGVKVPIRLGEWVSIEGMFSKLKESPRIYSLDRRITQTFYELLESQKRYWPLSGVTTYRLPWVHELTDKQMKRLARLCDEWNKLVSRLTGVEVPFIIPEIGHWLFSDLKKGEV